MDQVDKLNKLIADFNKLVDRRLKAEQWFDLLTTTDVDRDKWVPTLLKLIKDTQNIVNQLESMEFAMKPEFWWEGI